MNDTDLIHIFLGMLAGFALPCIFAISVYVTQLFWNKLKESKRPANSDQALIDELQLIRKELEEIKRK